MGMGENMPIVVITILGPHPFGAEIRHGTVWLLFLSLCHIPYFPLDDQFLEGRGSHLHFLCSYTHSVQQFID